MRVLGLGVLSVRFLGLGVLGKGPRFRRAWLEYCLGVLGKGPMI